MVLVDSSTQTIEMKELKQETNTEGNFTQFLQETFEL